jgi:hypothetical protein
VEVRHALRNADIDGHEGAVSLESSLDGFRQALDCVKQRLELIGG